ncbi:MAG: hypothetical protein LBC37_01295 [Zoogloeaceae bacterium]|jgi:hypothetical protein|nr:hypothetical protein [Zoogloeaceae bacterium]
MTTSSEEEEYNKARRRMQILLALSIRPDHLARPGSLLEELQGVGFPMTLTRLMVEIAFLAEMDLVDAPAVGYIGLTDSGLQVALGQVKLPGVGYSALGER